MIRIAHISTTPNHINTRYCKRKIMANKPVYWDQLWGQEEHLTFQCYLYHMSSEVKSFPEKDQEFHQKITNIDICTPYFFDSWWFSCYCIQRDIFLHFHPVCWRLFWWSLDSAVDALYPRPCTNQRPSYFCPQSLCLYWTLCWHLPTHHQPVSCQTASYKKNNELNCIISFTGTFYLYAFKRLTNWSI